jgi:hypothetical protein
MIKSFAKHFLLKYKNKTLNEVPIEDLIMADSESVEAYIEDVLMKDGSDANAFILSLMPIVMRINIFVINIDSSEKQAVNYHIKLIIYSKI